VNQTKAELASVHEEKSKLAEALQQTNQAIADLKARLTAIEKKKARNRKIWRVISGVAFSVAGFASLLWLPAFRNWTWLQSHPQRISLYLAGFLLVAGLGWAIFAWKHRAWALGAVILAVVVQLIGIL
jgi:hypothetical protein